jgi:hypothetical protein
MRERRSLNIPPLRKPLVISKRRFDFPHLSSLFFFSTIHQFRDICMPPFTTANLKIYNGLQDNQTVLVSPSLWNELELGSGALNHEGKY